MNKYIRMLAGIFLFGALAMGARAQATDEITVKVPYSFVVGNKTLPAGNYRVDRVSFVNEKELALTSVENRTGVLLIASETEVARATMPKLVFEKIGGEYVLIKIQTAEHSFEVPVSHTAILQATAKALPGAASGTD